MAQFQNPFLRGYFGVQDQQNAMAAQQFGMLGQTVALQNAIAQQQEAQQTGPLRRQLLEAQVNQARNPQPKWQVSERFNEQTGMKEKVLVNLLNPAQVIPFGGQEARNLSFQNMGGSVVGLDPVTGSPRTNMPTTASPYQQFQMGTQFPWQQSKDLFGMGMDAARFTDETAKPAPAIPTPSPVNWGAISGQASAIRNPQLAADQNRVLAGESAGGAGMIPTQNVIPDTRTPPLGTVPPRGAPTAPQNIVPPGATLPQPGAVPLSDKQRREVNASVASERGKMDAKREFNMGGIGEIIDSARSVLSGTAKDKQTGLPTTAPLPTQSFVGAGVDFLGRVVGKSPSGADQAADLRALAGALVAKMPRMEGPQSDRDTQNYKEMAGQIGDSTIPISQRMAALDRVEQIWRKYERGAAPTGGGWSVVR